MNGPSELGLDRLMQDGAWLRRFVGSLVASQDIDDVVQSTWLAAVEEPGAVRGNVASWLRGVSTNVARMLHRSRHRGARALGRLHAAGEAPATADVVAGLEVQRAVSDALLALPEPTRTILVLRYQQGLSPAAIAPRVGLKVDAVRQRLHRGREAVRERLSERFGADWRGSAAIAAFVRRPEVVATPAFGAAVLVVVLAAATLVLATLPAWIPGDAPQHNDVNMQAANRDATPTPDATFAAATVESTERALVAGAGQDPSPTPAPPSTSKNEVRGRLVAAESGSPIAGTVTLLATATSKGETTLTAVDGTFVIHPATDDRGPRTIWLECPERCSRWHDADSLHAVDLGVVAMTRGYVVRGKLVDDAGAPIAGVFIEASLAGSVGKDGRTRGEPAKTAADGSFQFGCRLPAGKNTIRPGGPGFAIHNGEIEVEARAEPTYVLLKAEQFTSIRGVAFGPDGAPCGGVELEAIDPARMPPGAGPTIGGCRSNHDGSFELFQQRGDAEAVRIAADRWGEFDVVDDARTHPWGTGGVRVEVRPRIAVHLRVVEAGADVPVERYVVQLSQVTGISGSYTSRGEGRHEGGLLALPRLSAGTRVQLWAADPQLAPFDFMVDEAHRGVAERRIELPRLQPFPLTLVDGNGQPVAAECWLLDRCGAEFGAMTDDHRARFHGTGRTTMRVSTTTTDGLGKATLLAPITTRELVLSVRRGKREQWLAIAPRKAGEALCLVVPD